MCPAYGLLEVGCPVEENFERKLIWRRVGCCSLVLGTGAQLADSQ